LVGGQGCSRSPNRKRPSGRFPVFRVSSDMSPKGRRSPASPLVGLSALDAGPARAQTGPTPGRLSRQGRAQNRPRGPFGAPQEAPLGRALFLFQCSKISRLPVAHSLGPLDRLCTQTPGLHQRSTVCTKIPFVWPFGSGERPPSGRTITPVIRGLIQVRGSNDIHVRTGEDTSLCGRVDSSWGVLEWHGDTSEVTCAECRRFAGSNGRP